MLNILFWSLNKNKLENYIVDCIIENEIDIAVFAEFSEIDFTSLEKKMGGKYRYITEIEDDVKLALFAEESLNIKKIQTRCRYNIYEVETNFKKYILTGVHLQDRRNFDADDRKETIEKIVNDIENTEKSYQCDNSIVIGDFNANPYDKEITSAYYFNAVLFKKLIDRDEYTKHHVDNKKRFYNPILQYISEDTGMYGSYYDTSESSTPYWYCLDQILVRKKLVNSIRNVSYLKKIKSEQLMGEVGPRKSISDHLPLVVRLEEI